MKNNRLKNKQKTKAKKTLMYKIIVTPEYVGQRLDKALLVLLNDRSRANIQNLIDNELILVNAAKTKSSYKLKLKDEITIGEEEVIDSTIKPVNVDLDIVYEDEDVLVINKKAGVVVHPANGHQDDTLVNGLLYHVEDLSGINGVKRPGIVHRIDKDTSGLLLVCKNNEAHKFVAEQLKTHNVKRIYLGLVLGVPTRDSGTIIAPLNRSKTNRMKMSVDVRNGKESITHFQVIERYNGYALLRMQLETGRTHQIRAHMEYIGHPLVGDPLYGRNNTHIYNKGQLLHAERLEFIHPRTKEWVSVFAPLPLYFANILDNLGR